MVLLVVVASRGASPAPAAQLSRGPYLQLLTSRSVTIVWHTDTAGTCGLSLTSSGGPPRTITGARGTVCALAVDGLAPGTFYHYVPTADGTPLAPESSFRTDDPVAPFVFMVLGDSGTGDASQLAVRDRMLGTPADFVLHTGDMVYEDGAAADFDPKFFAPYAELLRRMVIWPCLGNHDQHTAHGQPWRDVFFTPANNPAKSETYYSFDHGNAHVVVLDSNADTRPGSPQSVFLDQDLGASTATWKFVAFHHTIYTSGTKHGSNTAVRANLLPLLDRRGVDVVFMGHEHVYERTQPLRGDHTVEAGAGTVYITSGGGGGKLYPLGKSTFTAHAEAVHHFVRVAVDGGSLTADMIRADGSVGDTMTLVKPSATTGRASPSDPPNCLADADCDDGSACTIDSCDASAGCRHDPAGWDTLRSVIGSGLAAGVCGQETVPRLVSVPLRQALTLVSRAAVARPGRVRGLVASATRRLRDAGRRAGTATTRGHLSPGCAGALAAVVQTGEDRAACLIASGNGTLLGRPYPCLSWQGPLIRLSGQHTAGYSQRSLTTATRIDARGARFMASPANRYPITLDGGDGLCLTGGVVRGEYDRTLDWATMHDMNNAGVAFASPTTVDGVRVDDVTDGIRPRGTGPFAVRRVWLSYVRDDCVENDHVEGGVIEDSLFDGCYVAVSERPSPSIPDDGHTDLLTIRGSLIRLEPMPGPRGGSPSDLGHGEFFKWSEQATRLALYDNVFMAEQVGQNGPDTMGIPDRLAGCAHNVMVWLGAGDYPAPLPGCFTVTKDRSVWDAAVTSWKQAHPDVHA